MSFQQAFKTISKGAKSALLIGLNSLIVFALLNVAVATYEASFTPHVATRDEIRQKQANKALAKFGIDYFKRVYPDKSEAQIRQLIYDQTRLPDVVYEPYAEYKQPAYNSPTYNVHEAGFRLIGTDQGPWPLDQKALNVFVFGGSAVLGSGVTDDATIAAVIQMLLREVTGKTSVNVYNFGTQAYVSSQDVTLFQNLLRHGDKPDIAIFIEGWVDIAHWSGETSVSDIYRSHLNIFYQMRRQMNRDKDFAWHFGELIESLPAVKLVRQYYEQNEEQTAAGENAETTSRSLPDLRRKRAAAAEAQTSEQIYAREYSDGPEINSTERIVKAIARFLVNKEIAEGIARRFDIEPIIVWQPIPLYKYDLNYHPFHVTDDMRRARYGYPIMADYARQHDMGSDFLWCADIQEGVHQQLYVDHAHYNTAANDLIAHCVVDGLLRSGALERAWQHKAEPGETPLQSLTTLASPPAK